VNVTSHVVQQVIVDVDLGAVLAPGWMYDADNRSAVAEVASRMINAVAGGRAFVHAWSTRVRVTLPGAIASGYHDEFVRSAVVAAMAVVAGAVTSPPAKARRR